MTVVVTQAEREDGALTGPMAEAYVQLYGTRSMNTLTVEEHRALNHAAVALAIKLGVWRTKTTAEDELKPRAPKSVAGGAGIRFGKDGQQRSHERWKPRPSSVPIQCVGYESAKTGPVACTNTFIPARLGAIRCSACVKRQNTYRATLRKTAERRALAAERRARLDPGAVAV